MLGKRGSAGVTAFLLALALAQHVSLSVAQSPPPPAGICSGVNCQQGTCQPALIGYTCVCQEGWQNILEVPFLPCGIPKDCNINYTCDGEAGAPAPPPAATFQLPNITGFNPCTFSLCGFGKCVAHESPGLLTVPYSCVCDPGNSNVLNMSSGTCLPNCNFGGSCAQLGLPLGNSSPPPPPPPSTVENPPSAGLYPPGDTPGPTGPPSNTGKRSKEVTILSAASATIVAAVWLWV